MTLDAAETEKVFIEAGQRAEADPPDEFFARTGLDEAAFLAEVKRYCKDIDAAGTVGDMVVGYHLAWVLIDKAYASLSTAPNGS